MAIAAIRPAAYIQEKLNRWETNGLPLRNAIRRMSPPTGCWRSPLVASLPGLAAVSYGAL